MKKLILILLTTVTFRQSSIVAAGNETYTIGETFPVMQHDFKNNHVSLNVSKWDVPVEKNKPVIKKLTLFKRLLKAIFG